MVNMGGFSTSKKGRAKKQMTFTEQKDNPLSGAT